MTSPAPAIVDAEPVLRRKHRLSTKPRRSEWQAEARRMHADGVPASEIARRFGKSLHYVLDVIKCRSGTGDIMGAGPDSMFVRQFVYRKVAPAPADRMEACRAFAAGAIDRAELSRRLRGTHE